MSSQDRAPLSVLPLPLYSQIREILRQRIMDGTYKAHDRMPSESEMMRAFHVSRITVRQALNDLQKAGLIFRIHGKGTFVSKPKAFQNVTRLQGFGEAMASMGYETFSRTLGWRTVVGAKMIAQKLSLSEPDPVLEIRRLRYLNREPISLDVSYLPQAIGERLIQEDLATRDIFAILENDYGQTLTHAELSIQASLADESTARLLAIEEGAPILYIERLTHGADGQPLDYEHLFYRGDAFQYRLRIEGIHAEGRPS